LTWRLASTNHDVMRWEAWTLFVVTETVLCLTPGPAVLFVLSQGLGRGAVASLWASLGILAGNTFYFLLSATGLGALLLASYDLFFAIKWAGAAYLVWLGLCALRARGSLLDVRPATTGAAGPGLVARGFAVQAANPKALVFFTALLPQFIDPAGSVVLQVAILAATSIVVEFAVLAGYGLLAGRAARLAETPRVAAWLERAAGVLLIAAGLRMAALRRAG
jgi:threonine/homoserine/homoserine lactone efflux protein